VKEERRDRRKKEKKKETIRRNIKEKGVRI